LKAGANPCNPPAACRDGGTESGAVALCGGWWLIIKTFSPDGSTHRRSRCTPK